MRTKLAILSSHPIQYNAPMFELLAKSEVIHPKVFYTWSQSQDSLFDKDFGKTIQWDIPLLQGYEYEFITNISANPGPTGFKGIVCPDLNTKIKDFGADALLVYGWNYHAHYHAMKYFHGKIPVYFRGDSNLLDETGGVKTTLRRLILKWVYRYADAAFYVGENNRQYYLKHGFRENELFFAPHAIDNDRFSDKTGEYSRQAEELRKELGIGKDEFILLFVGKFESKKNPLLLAEAVKSIGRENIHVVFVGNGILEKDLKQFSAGAMNIHFLPFQNQLRMPVIYHLADIVVLPSQGPGETWGLAINEAMACNRAVLVSDKAGCSVDLVESGKNGYIFQSGNIKQCVDAIRKMTESKAIPEAMGKYSGEKIKAWSFREVVRSFEKNIKLI